jgi:hypothetical protein
VPLLLKFAVVVIRQLQLPEPAQVTTVPSVRVWVTPAANSAHVIPPVQFAGSAMEISKGATSAVEYVRSAFSVMVPVAGPVAAVAVAVGQAPIRPLWKLMATVVWSTQVALAFQVPTTEPPHGSTLPQLPLLPLPLLLPQETNPNARIAKATERTMAAIIVRIEQSGNFADVTVCA